MIEKIVRFIAPIAWVTIAFVGLCELLKYMFIFHPTFLEYTYPVILLSWIVVLFSGHGILKVSINTYFDKS